MKGILGFVTSDEGSIVRSSALTGNLVLFLQPKNALHRLVFFRRNRKYDKVGDLISIKILRQAVLPLATPTDRPGDGDSAAKR